MPLINLRIKQIFVDLSIESRESKLRLDLVDDKEIVADKLKLTCNFLLYAIKHKNLLWTRSRDLIRLICKGFQRTEQSSDIGITSVVYNVVRHGSFLNSSVLRIKKSRFLNVFEHTYSIWKKCINLAEYYPHIFTTQSPTIL